MTPDPLLFVFYPDLLRLILCGGEGLAAAWGPLVLPDGQIDVWAGRHVIAAGDHGEPGFWSFGATDKPWRLPLDHWRDRLALVAANMVGSQPSFAQVCPQSDGSLVLAIYRGPFAEPRCRFWTARGASLAGDLDLPTLPAHLHTHDPAVALPLAIWDATEGRDR